MLNPITNERELAFVAKVDDVKPIAGRDRVESVAIGGWTCMVPKGVFQPGSLGVYFEIDSLVDINRECFAFMSKYKGKVKTQRFKTPDGPYFSQGLFMPFEDLGLVAVDYKEGDFLTKELGVTYADPEDTKRKAKSDPNVKYKSMMSRHPKLAKSKFGRFCMRHDITKKILYLFLGRKTDRKRQWPDHIKKTDEERAQNLAHMIPGYAKERWIATEKVDGTSTTFSVKRTKGNKYDYYVCSRNVVMNQPGKEKTCYYAETDGNVYIEMSAKYNMEKVLAEILLVNKDLSFVTVQGETYGGSIQKRNYSIKNHDLAVFNVIFGYKDGTSKRLNPFDGEKLMKSHGVPYVPIIGELTIPDTCEGILELAGGPSAIDGLPREGIVFRSTDGVKSFKAVDNEFLVAYH